MSSKRLVVHHVGGRNGNRDFPLLSAFESAVTNVIYDADESCLTQITEVWRVHPSKTIVLPYCLAAKDGVCKFYINYDPCTSSVYPLNPKYAQFYYRDSARYDYVLGDTLRAMEEVQLQTTTLDAVVLDRGEVHGPDFLSIDTQGSELDILVGASRLLGETILAVKAEIELHPIYEGQPLLGDICKYLAKYNFDLVDIRIYPNLLPMRGKDGFRGEGYPAHGEALFLKRPDAVVTGLQLNKLAYIATVFGQFECAQQCFEAEGFAAIARSQEEVPEQQPKYLEFISRLAHAVTLLPQRSEPLFSDRYSYAQSRARFNLAADSPTALRQFLKAIPFLAAAVRGVRALGPRLQTLQARAMWKLARSGSAVEALFLEFGMEKQFLLAVKNRLEDSHR